MSESFSLPASISYKRLKALLANASKVSRESIEKQNSFSEDEVTFNEIITSWLSLSNQLMKSINENKDKLALTKPASSLMALGAMEAHLKLAIQALKASESES